MAVACSQETLEYLDADPYVLFGIDDPLTQQVFFFFFDIDELVVVCCLLRWFLVTS